MTVAGRITCGNAATSRPLPTEKDDQEEISQRLKADGDILRYGTAGDTDAGDEGANFR